jgi:hypothetical protein
VHFAGGGHNDALVALLLVGVLAASASGRKQLAGVAWVLAAAVKWVPLLLFPLRVLESRARGRSVGHLGFAAAAVVVVAAATLRYGTGWLHAFGPLARNANHETTWSIPHRLEQLGLPHAAALAIVAVAFAAAYALLAREAWRGRARLGLATCAILLALPYLVVWYLVWALPLAAAEDDEAAGLLSLALCAYLLRQPVPLSGTPPGDPPTHPPPSQGGSLERSFAGRACLCRNGTRCVTRYGGSTRRKTSTPSCSKTRRHAGFRRSHTICAAIGRAATRSA